MPRRGSKLKLIASNVRLTPEISLGHSILSIRLSRFRGPRPPPSLASGARKYFTGRLRSCQELFSKFFRGRPPPAALGPGGRAFLERGLHMIHRPANRARGNFDFFGKTNFRGGRDRRGRHHGPDASRFQRKCWRPHLPRLHCGRHRCDRAAGAWTWRHSPRAYRRDRVP